MTHLIALLAAAAISLSPALPKDSIDIVISEDNSGTVTLTHAVSTEELTADTDIPEDFTVLHTEDGYDILLREQSFENEDGLCEIISSLSYTDMAPETKCQSEIFAKQNVDLSDGIFYSVSSFSATFAPPPEGVELPEVRITFPDTVTEVLGGSSGENTAVFNNGETEIAAASESTAYATICIIVLALFAGVSVFALVINTKRKNAA